MRPKRACKKAMYCLMGGPYSGYWVYLTTPSTMVMSAGGWRGRYVRGNGAAPLVWEDMK
jgi:hypothetical protein